MRTLAFASALLGLALLLVATIAGGLVTPGYDHARQYISELGATGAATGPAVSAAFVVSGALQAVFWILCIRLLPGSRLVAAGFALSALNGLGLLAGGVFPCDAGCSLSDPSLSAVLHDVLGGLGYLCGVAGILLVAMAWRTDPVRRRLSGLALLCGMPGVMLIWMIHPGFELFGLAQRGLELAIAVWTLAIAFAVRRAPAG
ncbi:DUF998 domain-containing protein [Brevundimonas sp.]|uniref:DUF998 domain-containing protein n=1 Tax=Brevundimonas sp. TaxID=1871086 RepID=UPI0035B3F0B9